MTVTPDDLRAVLAWSHATLFPHRPADWTRRAGLLTWTCRRTLDHLPNTMLFYSAHLATRATERIPPVRDCDPAAPLDALFNAVQATGAILAALADAAPPEVRAFHPAGMADPEGFCAMGCDELLVHTYDIGCGLGIVVTPPGDVHARVLARLFPWAPPGDPWQALLWANGRVALRDRPRIDPDWYWWCAPLAEWDGTVHRRTGRPSG